MGLAGRGQDRMHCTLSLVAAFAVEFHGEYVFQTAVRVAAAVESPRAAEHRQPAAIADKVPDLVQINWVKISAVGEVIKDDHVEILELLQENIVDREGDQTQLILRHVHRVSRSSEKYKGDKLDQGILFHRHA